MKLIHIMAQSNYMVVNRHVAKKIGITNAILLSNLCSLSDSYGKEFFFTQEQLADTCCLNIKTVKLGIKYLIDSGILTIEKKGLPCRCYYTITELLEDIFSDENDENWTSKLAQNGTNKLAQKRSDQLAQKRANLLDQKRANIISNEIISNTGISNEGISNEHPQKASESFSDDFLDYLSFLTNECSEVKKFKKPMTDSELHKLLSEYSMERIKDIVRRIENFQGSHKRYVSLYLTAKNWLRMDDNRKVVPSYAKKDFNASESEKGTLDRLIREIGEEIGYGC